VSFSSEHPSEWTLELYAEEALPAEESAHVASHAESCIRCAGEIATLRSLFSAIDALPRFSPSPSFDDAVMARVRIAPQHSPLYSWLLRVLPSTRRGWMLFLGLAAAPALPIVAAVAWLLTNTTVTVSGLWGLATSWASDFAWSALVATTGAVVESNALAALQSLVFQLIGVPPMVLLAGALLFAIGIPLSAWTLYRTLRTPTRGTAYAL
jgi:anti-sigma factor RsiW